MSHESPFIAAITGFGLPLAEGQSGLVAQVAAPAAQKVCADLAAAHTHIVHVTGPRAKGYKQHVPPGGELLAVLLDERHASDNFILVVLKPDGSLELRGPNTEIDVDTRAGTARARNVQSAVTAKVVPGRFGERPRIQVDHPVQQELARLFGERFQQAYVSQAIVFAMQAQGKTVNVKEVDGGEHGRQTVIQGVN